MSSPDSIGVGRSLRLPHSHNFSVSLQPRSSYLCIVNPPPTPSGTLPARRNRTTSEEKKGDGGFSRSTIVILLGYLLSSLVRIYYTINARSSRPSRGSKNRSTPPPRWGDLRRPFILSRISPSCCMLCKRDRSLHAEERASSVAAATKDLDERNRRVAIVLNSRRQLPMSHYYSVFC